MEVNGNTKRQDKLYPKVYVLILNYNGWRDTIECLESVFRNDYPNYQDKASLCLQTPKAVVKTNDKVFVR